VSLLTKLTRPPTAIVTDRGATPAEVIVIVAVAPPDVGGGGGVGAGVGVGELGVSSPPPQDAAETAMASATNRVARCFPIRRISLKY
jgi:hypothetical protein